MSLYDAVSQSVAIKLSELQIAAHTQSKPLTGFNL